MEYKKKCKKKITNLNANKRKTKYSRERFILDQTNVRHNKNKKKWEKKKTHALNIKIVTRVYYWNGRYNEQISQNKVCEKVHKK